MESSKEERDSSKRSEGLDGGDSGGTEPDNDRAIRSVREESDNVEDSMQKLEMQDDEKEKMDKGTEKENAELSSNNDDALGESLYGELEKVTHKNEENDYKGPRGSLGEKDYLVNGDKTEKGARGGIQGGKLDNEHGKNNKQAKIVDDSEEKLNVLVSSLENHVTKFLEYLLAIRLIVLPLRNTLTEQIYALGVMVHLGILNVNVQKIQNIVILMKIGKIPSEYEQLAGLKGVFEEMQEDIYSIEYYTAQLQVLLDTYQQFAVEIQNATIMIHEYNNRINDHLELMSHEYESFNSNP